MNAIVYHSNTGYTERYAKALSKESGIRAYSLEQAMKELPKDSHILFMSWVKAGAVEKARAASKRFYLDGICAVGLNTSSGTERALRGQTGVSREYPFFMLPGGYDRSKLGKIDGFLMDLMLKKLNRDLSKKLRPSETELGMQQVLTSGGDFYDEDQLAPVMVWIESQRKKKKNKK